MNKYKIVALFGEAGSGKDYIQKKIIETDFGKKNLSKIIFCTTRPPHKGEMGGVNYHFIPTAADFLSWNNLHKWIEFSFFNNQWYGTSIDDLNKNKINIGIFSIDSIKQLLKDEEIDCLPIRITCYDKIRLIRQLNKENPDCMEIVGNFLNESKNFLHIPFEYKIVQNNTNEIKPVLEDIKIFIKEKWSF